ncbi:sensor histidine kinase [Hymenobacter sp. BT186]|uniref:Sensor histidine kinase n=1 Tax=Hymenobacter telluris TaxID=2816474 RepID=A0A939JED0_9BACT|nr:sensor histidine kinase [Hymenobacter telluris]MBO0359833.1 sensor histidine kinase [Hymenobacter telluris]MBW3375860.1 sensor histidine kinase [Hymenobacter norwichensis]
MLPINTASKSALHWHVLGWLLYSGYQIWGVFLHQGTSLRISLWLTFSVLFIRLIEFYLCYSIVYPRLLRAGKGGRLAIALAGVIALYIGARALIEEVIYPAVLGFHNYTPDTSVTYYIFDNLFFASPMIVISAAVWSAQAALRRERENQLLRGEKRTAELAFLKTQINPHFLYNTLNMLYGMAYPVAKPLANAILKLADLMRYMLHDSSDGQVELTQEIEYLHNYLDLYRLRFPDQFFVDFTVTGESDGHRVAPLLFIPFVENAIKHGVLDDPATPVRIHLALQPQGLTFEVHNQSSDYQKDATTGIGLPNLRRRLELLYPQQHTLQIDTTGKQFITSLHLMR